MNGLDESLKKQEGYVKSLMLVKLIFYFYSTFIGILTCSECTLPSFITAGIDRVDPELRNKRV